MNEPEFNRRWSRMSAEIERFVERAGPGSIERQRSPATCTEVHFNAENGAGVILNAVTLERSFPLASVSRSTRIHSTSWWNSLIDL